MEITPDKCLFILLTFDKHFVDGPCNDSLVNLNYKSLIYNVHVNDS